MIKYAGLWLCAPKALTTAKVVGYALTFVRLATLVSRRSHNEDQRNPVSLCTD